MDIEKSERMRIREALEIDFFIYEGLNGRHKHGGESVRYDLVLTPRQHLIDQGFDNGCVVVEVKLFNKEDKKKHDVKIRDLLWQCIAYSFSDVQMPNKTYERPLFVLYVTGGTGIDEKYHHEINELHHFVQRGGVGKLNINPKTGWEMIFGGSYYFRQTTGRGPNHVGTKRQTGSSRQ